MFEPSADILTLHYLGLLFGVVAAVIIALDLRIILNADWDVFTSRIFLRKDESMQTIAHITYLLSFAIFAITLSHLFLSQDAPLIGSVLHLLTTASLVAAMAFAYRLKRELAQTSDDANEVAE